MSPHILIDQELDAMAHPGTPISWHVMIQKQLTEMMADERITIEEFNHYCGRLNAIIAGRKEAA
ncbi:hypothetical protein [Pseudomonas fontis]|uniref:Prophage PssSM-02 n=1 Tax=Pseudomonas fontis TaxID=2942633 RepID=A0ABT5P0A9_9PSED|nr:hypothetical protein [Pseudomonas fontis]MDD0977104.1 hypothetical protein [Pseudomonas fontis]MDD0993797.1 hypothetical protein [Pseudomonas fontis]